MTKLVIALAVGVATAFVMELWAALLHRRLWHRWLWPLHRTHHRRDQGPEGGASTGFQANDLLSFLHAPVAVALIVQGAGGASSLSRQAGFAAGLGMTAFGLAYVLVHDGLVHGRLPVAFLGRWRYLARVRAAHRVHHRGGGPPYGLFLGPYQPRRRRARTVGDASHGRPQAASPATNPGGRS